MGLMQKMKLLVLARKPATEIMGDIHDMKNGYKTIAFWITVSSSLIALASAMSGLLSPITALSVTTALTAIYNILRGMEKADHEGVRPVIQSTEFWVGVFNSLGNALVALKTGGVNAAWLGSAQTIIAAAMGAAQNLGAQQPEKEENVQ